MAIGIDVYSFTLLISHSLILRQANGLSLTLLAISKSANRLIPPHPLQ